MIDQDTKDHDPALTPMPITQSIRFDETGIRNDTRDTRSSLHLGNIGLPNHATCFDQTPNTPFLPLSTESFPALFVVNQRICRPSFTPTSTNQPISTQHPAITGLIQVADSMFLDPLAITFPHLPPPSFWPIPRLDILPSIDAVAPMQHVACPFSPLAPRAHPNGSILAPFDLSGRAGGGAAYAPPFGLPAFRYGA